MKKSAVYLFYLLLFTVFIISSYWVIQQGTLLQSSQIKINVPRLANDHWTEIRSILRDNIDRPLPVILLQILMILVTARFFGFLCNKMGQPTVIGEIIAGIFLGPSFLGIYFPKVFSFIFPLSSLNNLQYLSQIGLILFMFVIGMELDFKLLKSKSQNAVVISHASILIPFGLGLVLAYYLYANYAPAGISFISFSLFIGIAMSITAFPVLARIVHQRGLSKTPIGTLVITCAAADDVTAWCMLAAVIAIVKTGSIISLTITLIMALCYVLIMIKVIGPLLSKAGDKMKNSETLNKPMIAIFFILLILSSYVTEIIGIHALFGAFMAGIIMPSDASFRKNFIYKIEDIALVLLLPLFFVFTGLKTHINLLNSLPLWEVTTIIIIVAFIGKFLGSAFTARFVGQSWKDSLIIGALMNTRGLVELVVLNIGYDLHILSSTMFSMLVIMALFTTFMTGPILDLINRLMPEKKS
ncbi:cation:proton antiporter [Mucilaginibacter sp. KACC 22063]|uniref:cation:proton antiporter n=1 Tax=Mucilaginibacter sp. KACC 22063 TaxID=3025666 RepID=UPI0030825346